MPFTERVIKREKPGPKLKFLWDRAQVGLGARITPKGVKSYVLRYRINGRERIATLGRVSNISLKDVRIRAAEMLTGIEDGIDPLEPQEENTEPTVADGLRRFFDEYVPARIKIGRLKPKTVRDYKNQASKYVEPVLGHLLINDVNRKDIEKLLKVVIDTVAKEYSEREEERIKKVEGLRKEGGKVKPKDEEPRKKPTGRTQCNRVLAFAQRLFSFLIEEDLRNSANPCIHVDRAKEKARQRVLSASEMNALFKVLDEMETEHQAAVGAIRVAALTGLRIGEILAIRWQDIDFDSGRLEIPESKQGERIHSLAPDVLEEISKQKRFRGCPWVFSTRGKAPITYKVVFTRLGEAAEVAGIEDLRLHDFRRGAFTMLAENGASAADIQAFAGHSSIHVAMRYVQSVQSRVKETRDLVAEGMRKRMEGTKD